MTRLEADVDDDELAGRAGYAPKEEFERDAVVTWSSMDTLPYLYDLVITYALDWPSLTCQWFPDKESPANKSYTIHRLLGTHTSGQARDYVQIATVSIPKRDSSQQKLSRNDYDDERGELGGHTVPPAPRIQVIQKISHEGEVNRARYMPQGPDLIATKAVSGEVFVFDRTKHPDDPEKDGVCRPDIWLVGQNREGYGLAWNPNKAGHILGASEDMTVCHWDVNSYTKGKTSIEPLAVYKGHTAVVGDVDWHATKENVFASVGDDRMLMIWDTRTANEPTTKIQAHDREVLSVAFSPASEHLLVTGSGDKTAILHDIRQPTRKLHVFEGHTDEVLNLSWSPNNPTIFASASGDRRINVWDLSLIGQEQTPDDQEDGPPELLFVHGVADANHPPPTLFPSIDFLGHTSRPTDLCWAPGEGENWTAASVSEDNVVMIWQPTMRIWAGPEVKIDVNELEENGMEGIELSAEGPGKREKETEKGKGKGEEGEEEKDGEEGEGEGNAMEE
ncbi:Histone acetyltransferase type B subunit 2 [Marasmius crinis-equi]|uniref:Histone acetyltransferase type B subunit 2 n=1 Tax=Marasmius crinis-equi TaxID=585013 RepID=A0ABR3EYZ9_9AGAR